ncbi:HAD-IA family hydrolase [Hwanghaeella sp.]|uniref:HAD-IA family hydrolase n=1 Tax=Hwanghaeella sp. TaxID=2605943 RepID=UPI003CCB907C
MTAVRLAVFDCDGTLVDSQHSIIESVRQAWAAEGLAPPSDEFIRTGVGLRLDYAVPRLAPDSPREVHDRLIERYKQAFFELRQQPDHEEPLYPGTIQALDALEDRGVLLAIATGKSRRGLNATLERHGLTGRFVVLKTADDGPSKPDPTILRDAVKEAGAEFDTTAMIGDTVFDISMACAARTHAIGVSWGYHPVGELKKAGASVVIDHYADLPGLLHRIWSK